MSNILSISSNAVSAYQNALSTVSNNIANVSTEGYSREEVVMQDTAPTQVGGNAFVGTGVIVASIKRDYDTFVDQNLRNSNSDLSAQTPMVNYSQQVMNTMGNQTTGLSSALDTFFSSANALSADPSSTVQRNAFLSSAGGVASRFAQLSAQIAGIATQAAQGLQDDVTQFNTLTTQLAVINKSLMKSPTLEGQPASLLDSRDLTLSKLSKLMKINTSFSPNGIVTVSLGSTAGQGVVVDSKGNATNVGVSTQSSGASSLVLDPLGLAQPLPNASGGEVAGYQNVITQVIQPTQANLDKLAQTFVSEANKVQGNGIDGYGELGQNLFKIDTSSSSPAAGVTLALSDPLRVAAASQFGVAPGSTNLGGASASVSYSGSTPTTALSNSSIVNNPSPTAAVPISVSGASAYAPVTTMSAGVDGVFYLDSASPGQQLQVLTKDGRQLLGQALTQTQELQMMTTANGFAPSATYSTQYLNQTGASSYRGLDLFYGAKASTLSTPVYDINGIPVGTTPLPATLTTDMLSGVQKIPAGALTLNGVPLSDFASPVSSSMVIVGLSNTVAKGLDIKFSAIIDGNQVSVTVPAASTGSLAALKTSLNASLQTTYGLSVDLTNNGQDLTITDPLNRSFANVSLAPVQSRIDVTGLSYGATAASYTFSAQIDGKNYSVYGLPSTSPSTLAAQLQSGLRAYGLSGLTVDGSGPGLVIEDPSGRKIDTAMFSQNSMVAGSVDIATPGEVSLKTDAAQVAQWINGTSQASFTGVTFDAQNPQPFSQFNATIGGVNFSTSNLISTDLPSLASELQSDLRAQDGSSNISVIYNGTSLQVSDSLGRVMSGFSLVPPSGASNEAGGAVTISQSNQTLTGVRAQASSVVTVPTSKIDLGKPLSLNGQTISGHGLSGFASYTDLVGAINGSATGLKASVNDQGELLITDPQGAAISVDALANGNALGLDAGSYPARVSLVKVIPDMTIPSTSLNFSAPLQVNGVSFGEATYQLPKSGSSFSTQFGSISGYDPATLQQTLNDKSSQVISGLSMGSPVVANAFQSFSVNVGGQNLSVNLSSQVTDLNSLAADIQAKLQAQDNSTNLTATIDGSGNLVVRDSSVPARSVNGMNLSLSSAGASATASTGKTQPRFSDSFLASVSGIGTNAGPALTVTALDPSMTDGDIASKVFAQANGANLPSQSALSNMSDLLARFSALQSRTGVVASLDLNGDLQLTTTDPTAQASISIGPGKDPAGSVSTNLLGLAAQDYDPAKRLQLKQASDPSYGTDIKLSFGTYGTPPNTQTGDPSMLSSLGLRTGAYMEGGSPDDLMVFVTGKGTAQVSASYSGQPVNQRDSLRSQSLEVKFTDVGKYQVIDTKTNTILAERTYDTSVSQPEIDYNGLKVTLSSTPSVGDIYSITGNFDGTGNNVNMLDMVKLAKSPVAQGKSLGDNYVDQVNAVGTVSQQATITQQALKAVNDQAVTAKSNVSGVTLDEEAASLIRFQQAYQAAAKALQVSGQLFDSIVQIR